MYAVLLDLKNLWLWISRVVVDLKSLWLADQRMAVVSLCVTAIGLPTFKAGPAI